MSNYTPVYTNIWSDSKFTEYTSEQQLIFLYLITNPSCKISGIYQVTPKQISYSTNIDKNLVIDSLKSFDIETLEYDSAAGIVFVKNHFRYNLNKIGNPKTMIYTLLKSSSLSAHDVFWKSFVEKYKEELTALTQRIKDFNCKNDNSLLAKYFFQTESSLNPDSIQTESSLNPDLLRVSISNSISNTSLKEKRVKVKKEKIEIPDFIDADLWNGYLKGRKKPTDQAVKLLIKKMTDWNVEGLDPNKALRHSIENGYTGLFMPNESNQVNKSRLGF